MTIFSFLMIRDDSSNHAVTYAVGYTKHTFDGRYIASRRCIIEDPWPFKGIAYVFPLNAASEFEILMIAHRNCSIDDKRKAQSLFYSARSGVMFWLDRRHVNNSIGRAWFQWNDVLYVAKRGLENGERVCYIESSVLIGPNPGYNYEAKDVGPRLVYVNLKGRKTLHEKE